MVCESRSVKAIVAGQVLLFFYEAGQLIVQAYDLTGLKLFVTSIKTI